MKDFNDLDPAHRAVLRCETEHGPKLSADCWRCQMRYNFDATAAPATVERLNHRFVDELEKAFGELHCSPAPVIERPKMRTMTDENTITPTTVHYDDGTDTITGALPDATDTETGAVQVADDDDQIWFDPTDWQRERIKTVAQKLDEARRILRDCVSEHGQRKIGESFRMVIGVIHDLQKQVESAGKAGMKWPA